jgi:hypothetical protein
MQSTGNLAETVHAFLAKEISFLFFRPGEKEEAGSAKGFWLPAREDSAWKIV